MTPTSLRRLVLAALFTALSVVGSYLVIPFVPVPLVLANFFTLLAGLLLGPGNGAAAVLLCLVLGALGLPVFAGGSGGFNHFLSPTGGFLLGYLASAVVAGLAAHGWTGRTARPGGVRLLAAGALGMGALYAVGLPWLRLLLPGKVPILWAAVLLMAPYMFGDALKVADSVRKWRYPVSKEQHLRLDQGRKDAITGEPYSGNAANPHVHAYGPDGKIKVRNPMTNDPHIPTLPSKEN